MLPNPMTPPPEAAGDIEMTTQDTPTTTSSPLLSTPTSNVYLAPNTSDSISESMEAHSDSEGEPLEMSDSDSEDGGAALSNVQEPDDPFTLDTDSMGGDDIPPSFFESPLMPAADDSFLFSDVLLGIPTASGLADGDEQLGDAPGSGGVPITINEVAQQLQHLQDNQEHEFDAPPTEQHTVINNMEDNINFTLGDFLYDWGSRASAPLHIPTLETRKRGRGPSIAELHAQRFPPTLPPVKRKDLQGDRCDIQRLDWERLGVSRCEARQRRRQTYKNYTNLRISSQWHPRLQGAQISEDEEFFKFRRMDFDHEVHLSHFQLRNLFSCASRDRVFYAAKSTIVQWNPTSGTQGPKRTAMDLRDPIVQPFHGTGGGIQISTIAVAHNILVAGGFSGEYALLNLRAHKDTVHTEGIVTSHQNSITNHLQVHLSRTSHTPQVSIASNDNGLRVLDVLSNKFVAEHSYDHAINCSAVSPDHRLRVLVGDSRQVLICNAETGAVLQSLEGHRDFGFACDWADDGWTVATGNQDMQIKIWDARKWTTSQGLACPVTTVSAEMAGARKLKFSPLGSGKRVLVAAEPADMISVINADTYASKQLLSFFGEIGGFDFTNGGRDLLVANCDPMRGGLMEFERCSRVPGNFFEMDDPLEDRHHKRRRAGGYDWSPTDEETTRHPRSWGTTENRRTNTTLLGSQMGHF